jgi:uracil-DNA glycosylase
MSQLLLEHLKMSAEDFVIPGLLPKNDTIKTVCVKLSRLDLDDKDVKTKHVTEPVKSTVPKQSRLIFDDEDEDLKVPSLPPPPVTIPQVDDSWTIERISKEATPSGWIDVFKAAEPELKQISGLLVEKIKRFYPLRSDIFKAFWLTPLDDVRVVIIGQDPYFNAAANGQPEATGLSFSVDYGVKVPSSLCNIYKEIKRSISSFVVPNHGCLEGWARQGVLMLNSCLTVTPGEAGSHSKYMLWMPFIIKVLDAIAVKRSKCIYVMWGKEAQKLGRHIGDKAIILESSHPSGRSAHLGFLGCGHFKKINELLANDPKGPINW